MDPTTGNYLSEYMEVLLFMFLTMITLCGLCLGLVLLVRFLMRIMNASS
jgi:hypothetical protein